MHLCSFVYTSVRVKTFRRDAVRHVFAQFSGEVALAGLGDQDAMGCLFNGVPPKFLHDDVEHLLLRVCRNCWKRPQTELLLSGRTSVPPSATLFNAGIWVSAGRSGRAPRPHGRVQQPSWFPRVGTRGEIHLATRFIARQLKQRRFGRIDLR